MTTKIAKLTIQKCPNCKKEIEVDVEVEVSDMKVKLEERKQEKQNDD